MTPHPSVVTRVAYKDDGLFRLLWLLVSSPWTGSLRRTFPPRDFVGRGCSLSVATDPSPFRVSGIRMRRLPRSPSTDGALLWRLTLEWERLLPHSPL